MNPAEVAQQALPLTRDYIFQNERETGTNSIAA